MSPPARPSRAVKLVTLAVTVLVALGAIEIALRYRFPIRGTVLRPNPVWLHEYIPDSRKLYRHPRADGGGTVLVTINHDGRRGPSTAPAGVPKVVVYGDSFMAAEYSPWPETFPAKLEALLQAHRAGPLQVIDAGVPGYGPDQSLLRLDADLPALQPQLVVLSVYAGNDFGDLARDKLFGLDESGGLVERHPTLAPALAAEFDEAQRWPSLQLARAVKSAWQLWRSPSDSRMGEAGTDGAPTANRFEQWLAQGRRDYEQAVGGDGQVTNLLADGYDAVVSLTPASAAAQYESHVMRGVLARAQAAALRVHVPLLLVVIPSPYDAVPDYPLKPDRDAYPDYRPETLSGIVAGIAGDLGIPCVNLFDDLSGPGSSRFFFSVGNDHWNAEGERVAAQRVASEIDRLQVLK